RLRRATRFAGRMEPATQGRVRQTLRSHEPTRARHRLVSLQVVLVLWALAVLARLFWLQVLDHHRLELRADDQQQRIFTVRAHRGVIFDRNLTPLAMSLPVRSLYANPRQIADPAQEAHKLAAVLDLRRAPLAQSLASRRGFVWVARQVTAAEAQQVAALDLKGIYSMPASRRFYPMGKLAANVLGFVGVDGQGLAGLEYSFDRLLHGHNGRALEEVDAHGESYSEVEQKPRQGGNLILTLDQNIQYIAQQALDKQVAAEHALRGIAVVQNPETGAILALAQSPSFDPDNYAAATANERGDSAVSEPYEPGSVFKLVTLSAALEQGLITPAELVNCQMGAIRVGGVLIHDHAPFGIISVTDILKHSSDVGAIKIGMKLGPQEFYHYERAFGFGQLTGVRLPGESPGILRPPSRWSAVSLAAMSMGQEIAVTPLQEISMVSALADGGVYHAPRLVLDSFTGTPPREAPAFQPPAGRRVVSAFVANEMKQMMAQVVLGGTGRKAQLDGYTAAGKTGTAQKADPKTHRYSKTNYVASFVGFAPINNPAVTILVVIDSPHHGSYEGGDVSAPVFREIADRVLPYLGVPHDIPPRAAPPAAIRLAAADAHEESQPVDEIPLEVEAAPVSPAAAAAEANQVVLDFRGSGLVRIPDFHGQSLRAVSETCQRLGLALSLQGDGVAQAQSLAPGTRVPPGSGITVRFEPPGTWVPPGQGTSGPPEKATWVPPGK
ncbi:MAG: penicillin-binding protein, partial [Terriglobales bacterium]